VSKFAIYLKRFFFLLILVAGLFFLHSCRYLEERGFLRGRSLKRALLWAKQDSARVADSLKKIQIVIADSGNLQRDTLASVKVKKPVDKVINKRYHIIVGSFSNIENARLRASEYDRKGFKTTILETHNQSGDEISLVSVIAFESRADAKKYLGEFHSDIDSKAWIYPPK
jgi:hypothetical protein